MGLLGSVDVTVNPRQLAKMSGNVADHDSVHIACVAPLKLICTNVKSRCLTMMQMAMACMVFLLHCYSRFRSFYLQYCRVLGAATMRAILIK